MAELTAQDLWSYHCNTLALLALCIVLVVLMFAVGVRLGKKCSPEGGRPRPAGESPRAAVAGGADFRGH